MNSSDFYRTLFKKIYVLETASKNPATLLVLEKLENIPYQIISDKSQIKPVDMNQNTLFINAPKARIYGLCPGSRGHLCCNYLTIDLYMGCPLGCTYCIMKSYLNFSPVIVNVETEPVIEAVIKLAIENPDKTIRIGTGEVGDSLFYDPLFKLSEKFVTAFAPYPNIAFELKTKTNFVDHLLNIPDKGKAVIGFSVNPESVITTEEGISARLPDRLLAAKKAIAAGFRVAFHFDPVFRYKDWENDYFNLIELLKEFPTEKIAWISIGTFRYTPGLKERIENRWYLYDEFVPCKDKKYRYLQKVRSRIYLMLKERLTGFFPLTPVYMCMESIFVWKQVFKKNPMKINALCTIFNRVRLRKLRGKI